MEILIQQQINSSRQHQIGWWLSILPGILFVVGLLCFAIPAPSGIRNLFFLAALSFVIAHGVYRVAKRAKR